MSTTNRTIVPSSSLRRSINQQQRASTSCLVFALPSDPHTLYLVDRRCQPLQNVPLTALLDAMRASNIHVVSILVVPGCSSMRLISWDCSRVFGSNDTGVNWFKGNEVPMSVQGTTKKTVTLEYIMEFIQANPIVYSGRCHKYAVPESMGSRLFFGALSQAFDPVNGTINATVVKLHTASPLEFDQISTPSPVSITSTPMLQELTPKCPSGQIVTVPTIEIRHGAQLIVKVPEFRYGVGKARPVSPAPKRATCTTTTTATKQKRKRSSEPKVATKKSRASAKSIQPLFEVLKPSVKTESPPLLQTTCETPAAMDEDDSVALSLDEGSVSSADVDSVYIVGEDSSNRSGSRVSSADVDSVEIVGEDPSNRSGSPTFGAQEPSQNELIGDREFMAFEERPFFPSWIENAPALTAQVSHPSWELSLGIFGQDSFSYGNGSLTSISYSVFPSFLTNLNNRF